MTQLSVVNNVIVVDGQALSDLALDCLRTRTLQLPLSQGTTIMHNFMELDEKCLDSKVGPLFDIAAKEILLLRTSNQAVDKRRSVDLANALFQSFTPVWTSFRILNYTYHMEILWLWALRRADVIDPPTKEGKHQLHRGTPFYFLAVSYFLQRAVRHAMMALEWADLSDQQLQDEGILGSPGILQPAAKTLLLDQSPDNYLSDMVKGIENYMAANLEPKRNQPKGSLIDGLRSGMAAGTLDKKAGRSLTVVLMEAYILDNLGTIDPRLTGMELQERGNHILTISRLLDEAVSKHEVAITPRLGRVKPSMFSLGVYGWFPGEVAFACQIPNYEGRPAALFQDFAQRTGHWSQLSPGCADFILATKVRNEVAHTLLEDPILDRYWETGLASVLSALVDIATRSP